jgi:exodeoxyribonuclease-3
MQIVSYNVAGLRAHIKKSEFHMFINANTSVVDTSVVDSFVGKFDIICLQETKAEEKQVVLPEYITTHYPYRYWNSTKGTTQRKGFSGVTIWSRIKPLNLVPMFPEFDEEGRIVCMEFEKFILVNVYVPNSQKFENERYYFREKWNAQFREYISNLQKIKDVIICGDMNVAHLDIDISNPKAKKNKVPGFFDIERTDFAYLLEMNSLIDVFRTLNPLKQKSTYWSNFLKTKRSIENGWGIDYFLISQKLFETNIITDCRIHMDVKGSDHCPISISING